MWPKRSSAAWNVSLSKSKPGIISCLAHPWGTSYKKILFRSYLRVFLHLSGPRNLGSRLYNSCSLSARCRSLNLLVLRIMSSIYLLCFMSLLLGKIYFRSRFIISCRCVSIIPPKIESIKSYLRIALPHSKFLSKVIFLTLDEVPVPTTALSKLVRICRISFGGLNWRSPI